MIYNCHSSGTVKAQTTQEGQNSYAGGFAGYASSSIISNSYNGFIVNASTINQMSSAHAFAGGFVGFFENEGTIDRSYHMGKITASTNQYGDSYAGRLIGQSPTNSDNLQINDAFNEGEINASAEDSWFGDNTYAGGIAGKFCGIIDRVYNSGIVRASTDGMFGGNAYAGGVCGQSDNVKATIRNSAILQATVTATSTNRN